MFDTKNTFGLIRGSEMNDWVGGSDPEEVGDACFGILKRYLTLGAASQLLDFGCGIGRVLLSILKNQPDTGRITGFDIVPQVIDFCATNIASSFPQTNFDLIQGRNDHYDQFVEAAGPTVSKSRGQLKIEYRSAFTGAYAFSVFTHVEMSDFQSLLELVKEMLKPGGEFLLTAFLLTPYSRRAIENQTSLFPFGETAFEMGGDIFIGNVLDRLGFIAFDMALVEKMIFDSGLVLTHIEHGAWSGSHFSSSLQDVIVCRRPQERPGPTVHVPTVARPLRQPGA
jgi:SAM-dependent methyltransferase